MQQIVSRLAEELAVSPQQVTAAVALLDEGATVPFISRYRKEATGGLDDTQLRNLEERLGYLRELEERRAVVLRSIGEQGKLTEALQADIDAADTKTRLEDLYRPYVQKRRTKAQIAREAGLAPLAQALLEQPGLVPEEAAAAYLNPDQGIGDTKAALDGARQILMEQFADDADLLGELRALAWEEGRLRSRVVAGKEQEGAKFRDYFDASEALKGIPSHRALAMFRGQAEGVLEIKVLVDELDEQGEPKAGRSRGEQRIAARFGIRDQGRPGDAWLRDTVRWTWRVKLSLHVDLEMKRRLREAAEAEAIRVFGRNLHDLLLAAPAGQRATMGLDPGIRTGVKVAVVDATGQLVDTATIYPHAPKHQWDAAIETLARLAAKHGVDLVSIGNGTASRETEKLVGDLRQRHPQLKLTHVLVSEAGASIYSASESAAREFPELDVSLRGAVSIARRLQDPLAELVKIEPKAIGVGQYQHDVSQVQLARTLDHVVEDCVNAVGVDVNTASVPLLARVSGLNTGLAENIVAWRNEHGPFPERKVLLKVPRLGPKAFEQAAGFLRIMNGRNTLDASAVHPEAYPVVERILAGTARDIRGLIGDSAFLRKLAANDFTDERFGEPTVRDILGELEKPGRDPRPEFRMASFKEGVEKVGDLQPGMILEGVVTNVANFGAFVDVGVHQDSLVHVSQLADRFVSDPHAVVKAGDIVKVKVLEVDAERKRISLSLRLTEETRPAAESRTTGDRRNSVSKAAKSKPPRDAKPKTARAPANNAMAAAFAKLKGAP
ncbi:MAG: Tex family protein [Gammaproteobacteria bacterium]